MNKPVLIGIIALLATPSLAITNSFPTVADTFINGRFADRNAGGHTHVAAGRDGLGNSRRGLLQFDLSSIPAGSTVISATLELVVVIDPNIGSVNSNFELHTMTAGWLEGTKAGNNGAAASLGEVTWNSRAHGFTAWSGSPGANGDFNASASASTAVTGLGNYVWTSAQLTADVQNWISNPGQNLGWILISDNELSDKTARAFGSRENAVTNNRPELVIEYTPPLLPEDIVMQKLVVSNSTLTLEWSGPTNLLYDVQYRQSLTSSNDWVNGEAYIASATSGSNTWADVPLLASPLYEGNSNAFYRVQGLETNITPLEIEFDIVASGLTAPLLATHAGDGSGRLFIVEQVGRVRVVDGGSLLPTPFLDVSSVMVTLDTSYDERGLLGLAFHPDYENNGRFFVHYSAPPSGGENNLTTIAEYAVSAGNSNVANAASAQIVLQEPQPEFNHAGGTLAFGPDGFLYLAIGDGGGANDAHGVTGNGQNRTNLLGSIIRIDIDSASPYAIPTNNPFAGSATLREEIYAYGLRNPYQFSFDRGGSNELFCGDVGQALWEEINIIENGGNYGWRIAEGNHAFDLPLAKALGVDLGNLKYPIHNYKHGDLGTTVIGGFVYRGNTYPELVGKYVFGDFSTDYFSSDGKIYYLSETRPGLWQRFEFSIQPGAGPFGRYVKGFGEDEDGEIYVLSDTTFKPTGTSGAVRKLVKP
jgi:glucose/arabinose dehydrogenase